MASLANAAKAAEELHRLSGRLHAHLIDGGGDFTRLVELADSVGEKGDLLAAAFHEVDQVLRALVHGDGRVTREPVPGDDAHADDGTAAGQTAGDGVVSELRTILERLAALEKQLEDTRPPAPPVEPGVLPVAEGSHGASAASGSATAATSEAPRGLARRRNGGYVHDDLTRAELYTWARQADVPGRSRMSKDELVDALRRAA